MAGSRRKKGHRENSGYDRNIATIIPSPGSPPTEILDAKNWTSVASGSAVTRGSDEARAIFGQRIFKEFASGISPRVISRALDAERVSGQDGNCGNVAGRSEIGSAA
jgi:hypothetical protein